MLLLQKSWHRQNGQVKGCFPRAFPNFLWQLPGAWHKATGTQCRCSIGVISKRHASYATIPIRLSRSRDCAAGGLQRGPRLPVSAQPPGRYGTMRTGLPNGPIFLLKLPATRHQDAGVEECDPTEERCPFPGISVSNSKPLSGKLVSIRGI